MIIQKDICFECGSNNQIEYHHVIPKVSGGTKTIPLCLICHSKVHGTDLLKLRELARIGYQKRRKENPWKQGKPIGSVESIESFTAKPKVKEIYKLLLERELRVSTKGTNKKLTIDEIVRVSNSSLSLVYKVKKYIKQNKIGQQ